MKLIAPAAVLADALSLATAAVRGNKKPAPIMHIVADTDTVSFTCCDSDIAIHVTVAASISEPGEATVAADRLGGLVAALPTSSSITLSATETAIMIRCGGSRYRLPVYLDAPTAISIDTEIAHVEISGSDLLYLFEVLPAAGTEAARFFLTGVYVHTVADQLVAVATDGTKLLRTCIAAEHFSEGRHLILPAKAVTALIRLIKQTNPDKVTLRRSGALFAVTGPGFEFITGLVDAKYPDYERVLPRASTNVALCRRSDLIGALARLDAVANVEPPLVALSWVDGGPLILSLPRQPGDATDFVAAEAKGAARIALSIPQLTAMVANFSSDRLHLEASGGYGPLALRGERNKFGVLMGCRWNFDESEKLEAEKRPALAR
jgi:DNA polymerase-3 subunit beta